MSLAELPVEVLEEIFQYLDVADMVNAWKAVRKDAGEGYWARVCRREGYIKLEGVEDSWKNVIHRDINWRSQNFVRREYILDEAGLSPHLCNLMLARGQKLLHCGNILITDYDKNALKVLNISSTPSLTQTIEHVTYNFYVCGSKLVVNHEYEKVYKIYEFKHGQYCEIFQTEYSGSSHVTVLSDEFFVFVVQSYRGHLFIVIDLVRLEEFCFFLEFMRYTSCRYRSLKTMSISSKILHIVCVTKTQYSRIKYNLHERVHVPGDVFISTFSPSFYRSFSLFSSSQVEVHEIMCNRSTNVEHEYSNLLILNVNGKLMEKINVCKLIAVEGEYVIYFKRRDLLYIWKCKSSNDGPRELRLDRSIDDCIAKDTVCNKKSSPLLILTYGECFRVISIEKATHLYDVKFENVHSQTLGVFVDQCYYALCLHIEEETPKAYSTLSNPSYPNGKYSISKFENHAIFKVHKELLSTKNHKVIFVIYDFRNEA